MIQLYFKGAYSNSCQEVPDGTMITVESNTFDAKYKALKEMGCSHGAASFAANSRWETAQEREKRMAKPSASKSDKTDSHETETTFSDDTSDGDDDNTAVSAEYAELKKAVVEKELAEIAKRKKKIASDTSISATERLQETLDCIVQTYHSLNSVAEDSRTHYDLERKTISEIKRTIRQSPIPNKADELTDFIKYVLSGAIKPKKKGVYCEDMNEEDKVIGNLLYQKLWEIAEVMPEHPLIVPIIKKEQLKKRIIKESIIEGIGIINVVVLVIALWYPFLIGLCVCVAGWLANIFAEVDKKYPIQIKSIKLPTHLLASIVLNIIFAIIKDIFFPYY